MSKEQFRRYQVIQATVDGKTTILEASQALGLSTRQILRLKKGVKSDGASAIIHGNTNRKPANSISSEEKKRILDILSGEEFKSCNFSHFRDILSEYFDIEISYSSLYRLLSSQGLKSPKKRRRKKTHRRRARRPQAGLLVQVDATPYQWFSGDSKSYALHGAIDDATGQILALYMTKNECLRGYFNMARRMIENYGIPVSLYADRHTIFQSPNKEKAEFDSSLNANDTQFGRSLKELGIQLIPARSPQAKGRIERLWGTLQSRLPVEFSLNRISTLEAANEYLSKYIYQYNSQFAVEPKDSDSMFIRPESLDDLNHILCVKETRTVDAGGVFSYKGRSFVISQEGLNSGIYKGTKVDVLVHDSYSIAACFKGRIFSVLPYIPPKRASKVKMDALPKSKAHKPTAAQQLSPEKEYVFSEEYSYPAMLEMLNEILEAPY